MQDTTTAALRPQHFSPWPKLVNLLRRRSSSNLPPSPTPNRATDLVARASACALVAASAGFGAVYAWATGSGHGYVLGALSVLFAVALEVAKPLALRNALAAFSQFHVVRGSALIIMAAIAVVYSLTAELSLWAAMRSDAVAARQSNIDTTTRTEKTTKRADDRYAEAKAELAALPVARSSAEVKAEITKLLAANPLAGDCTVLDGRVTRSVCPQVDALKAEVARSDRREVLKKEMAAASISTSTPATPPNTQIAKTADPGAAALSTYLAALGIKFDVNTLSEWLSLIPVLALEIGSLFAGLLCAPSSRTPKIEPQTGCSLPGGCHRAETPASTGQAEVFAGGSRAFTAADQKLSVSDCAAERLVHLLKTHGGEVFGGQRTFARAIGTSPALVNELLHELKADGRVALDVGKQGTRVRLTANRQLYQ